MPLALDPLTSVELARAWLRDASLEHASIASFARFTLQALALGAPADLVARAQLAGLDEVAQARLCFTLASRYAETPIGPGVFPMEGVLGSCTLAEAAAASVREGCVGETLAALQARLQLEHAEDPDVRMALQRIADDEARHAELAWRFVRWALAQGDRSVHVAVEHAFRESLARVQTEALRSQPAVDLATWRAHGRLTVAQERACQLDAAREVIEPCLRTLLDA